MMTSGLTNQTMCKPVKTLGLRPLWLIREYSKPAQLWRTTCTPSAQALHDSKWIMDFWGDVFLDECNTHEEDSLLEWLSQRFILGPPRARTERELDQMDTDYLTSDEYHTHYLSWVKTWPRYDDHSWCTGPYRTTLPEWVEREYTQSA